MYFWFVFIFLVTTVGCANILSVFLFPVYSHHFLYQKICRELSLRGHQVTTITTNPINDPKLSNLTEIDMNFLFDIFKENDSTKHFSSDPRPQTIITHYFDSTYILMDKAFSTPEVRNVISNRNKTFDLVLKYYLDPMAFAFGSRFNAPVVDISPGNHIGFVSDRFALTNHPILYPDFQMNIDVQRATLVEKWKATYYFLWSKYYYNYVALPRFDTLVRKFFGKDVPSLSCLTLNASMLWGYTNPLVMSARPNVPAVIDLLPLEKTRPKALPEDLNTILNNATEGIVYISFGSYLKPTVLDDQNIIEAVSEMPYKILWKRDSDVFQAKPSNIITRKWFPQEALLAHPNVKVFVTHGGIQSIEQSIAAAVPMIGIPFFLDQPVNIRRMVDLGVAEQLHLEALTKTELKDLIVKVAETKAYKRKVEEIRNILYNARMTGLEKAVWWSEYVIRHKGTRHLRDDAVDTSLLQYLLWDAILFIFLFVFMIYAFLVIFKHCCIVKKKYYSLSYSNIFDCS